MLSYQLHHSENVLAKGTRDLLIASFSVSFNAHFLFLIYLYNYLALGFDNLSPFGFYDTDSPGFLHVSFAYFFYFVQSLNIFQDFGLSLLNQIDHLLHWFQLIPISW